jgi:hypothetical protein
MDTRNSESVKDFEKGSSMRKAPSTEWPLNITTHACKQFTEKHYCTWKSRGHGLWLEAHLCARQEDENILYWHAQTCAKGMPLYHKWKLNYIWSSNGPQYKGKELSARGKLLWNNKRRCDESISMLHMKRSMEKPQLMTPQLVVDRATA